MNSFQGLKNENELLPKGECLTEKHAPTSIVFTLLQYLQYIRVNRIILLQPTRLFVLTTFTGNSIRTKSLIP